MPGLFHEVATDLIASTYPRIPDFGAAHPRGIRQAIAKVLPGTEVLAAIDMAERELHTKNRPFAYPQFQ